MTMLRTIQVMALVALTMHLILGVTLYVLVRVAHPVGPYLYTRDSALFNLLLSVLYVTSYLLAFALGVVTLVAAAQQRRRRWFIPLLPLTVLVGYTSLLPQIITVLILALSSPANPATNQVESAPPDLAIIVPVLVLGLPAALAFTALAYATRGYAWAVAHTGAPSDRDDAEDQLQVSSIDMPLDVTR